MVSQVYRVLVFALYQFSIVAGIALLPVALATSRIGVSLPIGRVIQRLHEAHENCKPETTA